MFENTDISQEVYRIFYRKFSLTRNALFSGGTSMSNAALDSVISAVTHLGMQFCQRKNVCYLK
jgi:hypothetical protein